MAHLRKIGPPHYKNAGQVLAMEELAERYGGVFHKEPRRTWIMVRAIFTGLVTPWELISIHRGIHASLEAMTPELLNFDLERAVPSVGVPVFFFLGRYDRHVDSTIAAGYFETLRAPSKQLIWFEDSAHHVPFEEPEWFNEIVVSALQSVAIRRQSP